jgi:Tol biopolymer transport system component
LDRLEAVPIRGTAGATRGISPGRNPFFSPDGKWVGFWQDGKLKKVLADGGTPVDICEAGNPFGATWATDNTIVYGAGPQGIYRVSADGGKPALIVRDPAGLAHGPQLLPGGRTVLFTLRGENDEWDEAQIVVQSLDTEHREVLIRGGTDARYLETGHLVYVGNGTLFSVPFDATSLKVSGGPVSLAENIAQSPGQTGAAHFSISRTGSLAYVAGSFRPTSLQTLVWLDRQGHETPLKAPARGYVNPRVSPDEMRIAVAVRAATQNIWMWDIRRETLSPLSSIRARHGWPAWTRNGERLAFSTSGGIWWQAGDGSGSPERLIEPSFRRRSTGELVRARR